MPQRRRPAILCAAALCSSMAVLAAQPIDDAAVDRLISERRFFELRDGHQPPPGDSSPGSLYVRGVLASRFNRIDDAVANLTAFIERSETRTLTVRLREAYATLADLHRRSHRYRALVASRRQMIAAFRPHLTPGEIAEQEERLRLWDALRDVPPQTVELGMGTDVPLADGLDIDVSFPTGTVRLNPDTGSGLSIITRSDAVRLGLRIIEVPVGVTTVTGSQPATLAVAPEMRIGPVTIRHAVFLVFPDRALYRARQGVQRHGTIGAPVLAALGAISFTRAGRFIVHRDVDTAESAEFFLEDFDPVVDARFAGSPIRLAIDTGADESTFWPLFDRDFGQAIRPGATRVDREVGSVGAVRRLTMLEVPRIGVSVGRDRLDFPTRRLVLLDATTADHRLFHGSLGRDVYRLRERLTISYTRMRVALGAP